MRFIRRKGGDKMVDRKKIKTFPGRCFVTFLVVMFLSISMSAFGVQKAGIVNAGKMTFAVEALQKNCHGVSISPAGCTTYSVDEEVTYTIKGSENMKPSYFVIDFKEKVVGTFIDEYTMTYTLTEEQKRKHMGGMSLYIYGIGETTPDSTYTVDTTIVADNGIIVRHDKSGTVQTYSSDEEAVYTLTGMYPSITPGYFVINGKRVEGRVEKDGTLSYTFPKGTTGFYTLYGAEEEFRDVGKKDWFYDNVTYVSERGIMTGLEWNVFGPAQTIPRAQFIVVLYRMAGKPKLKRIPDIAWEDVNQGWYYDAVVWGFEEGIMKGYSHTAYWGTADNITREQLATVMYRYASYKGYEVKQKADITKFEDAGAVSPFARDAVQWAVAEGIITGKDAGTKLAPQESTTRAECAAVIQRFIQKYESL